MKKIEMEFLPDVHVACETCKAKRFNRETLEVRYKGKSIADVLDMTVEQAVEFFESIPKINRKVQILNEVGLGYITLGQHATTLSGGEAQRVKLAEELSKKDTGKTIYILDEPTTGLHFKDIQKLLEVLQKLANKGNMEIFLADANLYMEAFGILNVAWQWLKQGMAAQKARLPYRMASRVLRPIAVTPTASNA